MCHAPRRRRTEDATGPANLPYGPSYFKALFRGGPSFLAIGALVAVSILSAHALPMEPDVVKPNSEPSQAGESSQEFEARRENEMRAARLLGPRDVYPHKYIFVGGGHHR